MIVNCCIAAVYKPIIYKILNKPVYIILLFIIVVMFMQEEKKEMYKHQPKVFRE